MSLTSSSRFGLRETSEYRGHSAQDALREGQKNEQGKNAKREYARAFEEVKAQRDEHHDKGSEHGAPWGEHAAQHRHAQHQEQNLDTDRLREDEQIQERRRKNGNSDVEGQSVSVRVEIGGPGVNKETTKQQESG